ncbi:hypothetical protein GCM10011404_28230 [Sphingomonas prati]|nr:hypothetical protein GCM10011404_28230 [Sphingomonas prati]
MKLRGRNAEILAVPAAPQFDDAQVNERQKLGMRIFARNDRYWVYYCKARMVYTECGALRVAIREDDSSIVREASPWWVRFWESRISLSRRMRIAL